MGWGAAGPRLTLTGRPQVREEYRKWAYALTGNKYSEFASSTASSSQQTRVRTEPVGRRDGGVGPPGRMGLTAALFQALRPSESGM